MTAKVLPFAPRPREADGFQVERASGGWWLIYFAVGERFYWIDRVKSREAAIDRSVRLRRAGLRRLRPLASAGGETS